MKDTDNLLDHNQWSAGEYQNNLSSFDRIDACIITNTYSYIGESCIRVGKTSDTWWANLPFIAPTAGTYTATMKVLNLTGYHCTLRFYQSTTMITEVNIPVSNVWQTISLSATISSTEDTEIRILNYGNTDDLFFDDVIVVKS